MVRKNLFRLFFSLIVLISAYNVSYAMEGSIMNDTAITAFIKTKKNPRVQKQIYVF